MMDAIGLQMRYFVLKPSATDWHGAASRAAMRAYAEALPPACGVMAQQILDWIEREELAANDSTTLPTLP